MTYLLDLNLLIALAWPSHVHHRAAQEWFRQTGKQNWASSPLTQTGFIRISSNPKFIDGAVTPKEAVALLEKATKLGHHQFWPDDLDITSTSTIPTSHLLGHQQVTDAYLLGLAIDRKGKLATLDASLRALLPGRTEHKQYLEIIDAS